jgi:spermidine synthase
MDARRDAGLRRGTYFALTILGACSQVAQALLGRDLLVVFHGNEVSLGAFFGAWLAWIAVGAIAVARLRGSRRLVEPLRPLRTCLLVMPFALAAQIVAARGVRVFLDVPTTELVPLGQLLVAVALITIPTSLIVGIAFPLACEVLARKSVEPDAQPDDPGVLNTEAAGVSRLYVFEAAGALLGGLLFTAVLVDHMGVWRSLGVVAVLLALAVAALSRNDRRVSWTAVVVGAVGLVVALSPVGRLLQRQSEEARFSTLHPGLELLDTVETRYGHVAVGRSGGQTSIVHDGRIGDSFPDRRAVAQRAAYFHAQSNGARRVLLLGGVAGGLAAELLHYPVEHLDAVDEDRRAFERVRPHLEARTLEALDDPRVDLHFEDPRRFVNRLVPDLPYDLVLVLTPDPSSARLNRYFTRDFYRRLREVMAPAGVLCTEVGSASNYLGREVGSYSGSLLRTIGAEFPEVTVAPGDVHTFCAGASRGGVTDDPEVLARRYEATEVEGRTFPATSFEALLPAERVKFVRRRLEEEQSEVNTDFAPITYYLNMVLWGQYTSSDFVDVLQGLRRMKMWTYLVPLAVLVGLLLVRTRIEAVSHATSRRTFSTLAIAVLGFIAMAAQLVLLLSYQAHVGFVFGRIALLNGVFMTGLALGAGLLGQRLSRARRPAVLLALDLLLVAGACALLPDVLRSLPGLGDAAIEGAYLGLVCGAGLLTGAGFPLGVAAIHRDRRDVLQTSGVIDAADHIGGAVGGIVAGAFLIPLLGIEDTSNLLLWASVIVALPLLLAGLGPDHGKATTTGFLADRGRASFPFSRLSWGLVFLAITVFSLSYLGRQAAPGPVSSFDDAELADVSGSRSFELVEEPWPHYIGDGGDTPERTVSLASMLVAAEVRGYAGPLNLLVSVDDRGVLRGVRHVHSDETPSYIGEIDQWLGALSGRDLRDAPLDSETVDVMSGATVSSEAALASIDRAARAGAKEAFGLDLASKDDGEPSLARAWLAPRPLAVGLLLLLFFPVYLRGGERARLAFQAATLVVLGVLFNTLLTEVDVANLSRGNLPSASSNPTSYLLIGFALVTWVLWGQVYCGFVCPFGALQEFLSRLGRGLHLRIYVSRPLDMRARYLKYVLLVLILTCFWITGDLLWVTANPMQHVFGSHVGGWILLVSGISLVGALVHYRFWCRYFCPLGALLALGNKIALLRRISPQRRYERCDLGVSSEFDLDCIHCHRCITAVDTGVRRRGPGWDEPGDDVDEESGPG